MAISELYNLLCWPKMRVVEGADVSVSLPSEILCLGMISVHRPSTSILQATHRTVHA